mmetsp:Transcript_33621/g.71112  ORF Transcript_33621/g.71112 Transcript_33621/m.71112 type:complete len:202 (+) Transcript_33621:1855-2460(+)
MVATSLDAFHLWRGRPLHRNTSWACARRRPTPGWRMRPRPRLPGWAQRTGWGAWRHRLRRSRPFQQRNHIAGDLLQLRHTDNAVGVHVKRRECFAGKPVRLMEQRRVHRRRKKCSVPYCSSVFGIKGMHQSIHLTLGKIRHVALVQQTIEGGVKLKILDFTVTIKVKCLKRSAQWACPIPRQCITRAGESPTLELRPFPPV